MNASKPHMNRSANLTATTEKFNEKELLKQVAEGSEKAFRVLFNYYWQNIKGVAMAFTKSDVLAEEMVQDIFLKIWLKRAQLESVNDFNSYLFILARNHILNVLRKKITEQPFTEALLNHIQDTSPSPDDVLTFKQTQEILKKAVCRLPLQQRLVFKLTRDQGLSHESIAKKLRISKHTVKSHIHKALLSIRSYMEHTVIIISIFFIPDVRPLRRATQTAQGVKK